MKRYSIFSLKRYVSLLCGLALLCSLSGCKEDIDMTNRYTFTDETVASYLEKNPQYSEYCTLLSQVKISRKSASTVRQLLAARGNFTCFAPSNAAIQGYLDSLQRKGLINEANWASFESDRVRDSIREVIVYNSIIDGGDLRYYEISDFPLENEEINTPNMNDRLLTVNYGTINPDSVFINGCCISLSNRDIPAINGCIHEMEDVIAPSNASVGDLLRLGENTVFFSNLVNATGWADTLNAIRDEAYENAYLNEDIGDIGAHPGANYNGVNLGTIPEHRKYGFTVFAENDEVYKSIFGKEVAEITLAEFKEYLVSQGYYPGATTGDDYTNPLNIVNQFVAYHILPYRLPYNQLVIHYNEKGYSTTTGITIPVFEYYETIRKGDAPRKILKLYESQNTQSPVINRFPVLNRETYMEESVDGGKEGFMINLQSGNAQANTAINGLIYTIQDINNPTNLLVYTDETRKSLKNERMRYDLCALLPELANNSIRRPLAKFTDGDGDARAFHTNYPYFENMTFSDQTECYYLTGYNWGWQNYQGDEFNMVGRYDITLKLPPVPESGTYEIRYVISANNTRGMCQVYWGEDKTSLPAMGIPLDLRMGGQERMTSAGTFPSIVGWDPDTNDEGVNADIDKRMRNNGFMKGPDYYCASVGSTESVRKSVNVNRRILLRENMEPNKTYYLKLKSVLDAEDAQFYFDFIEFCAKEVYDNPTAAEDKW